MLVLWSIQIRHPANAVEASCHYAVDSMETRTHPRPETLRRDLHGPAAKSETRTHPRPETLQPGREGLGAENRLVVRLAILRVPAPNDILDKVSPRTADGVGIEPRA